MDKNQVLALLDGSISFSDEEKANIREKYDEQPAEFIEELTAMLTEERKQIDRIEQEYQDGLEEDLQGMKDEFVEAMGDEEKAEEAMQIVRDNYFPNAEEK